MKMRKTAATATHEITSKDHSLAADVVALPKVGLTDNNYKQQVKHSRVVVACLVTKRGALLRVALKVGEERLGVVFRLGGKPHVLPLTHTQGCHHGWGERVVLNPHTHTYTRSRACPSIRAYRGFRQLLVGLERVDNDGMVNDLYIRRRPVRLKLVDRACAVDDCGVALVTEGGDIKSNKPKKKKKKVGLYRRRCGVVGPRSRVRRHCCGCRAGKFIFALAAERNRRPTSG